MHLIKATSLALALGCALSGCSRDTATEPAAPVAAATPASAGYFGTLEPFAANAVYFVVTDRFVNGDTGNDQREQGGANRTFDIALPACDGVAGNIGYLGGDFKGIADNLDYIHGMGFGAIWITPIVDNPDQAFTGGNPPGCSSILSDKGKTGYHGYWGVNFYKLDEHLPSPGLDFRGLTKTLRAHGLKTVLDIVANHGSPAYTMPVDQPKFGEIYDGKGTLIADHMNLPPEKLDPKNPLNAFYNRKVGIAQLSDLNENDPRLLPYLLGAYEQWIDQGADAFRIDTIGWLPHSFWHAFSQKIREKHPGFFMFGEAFDYDAKKIAEHTWAENANVSVLDFPLKQALANLFEKPAGDFASLAEPLHLTDGPYTNPYELMTFYDNHDMPRMDASDAGFIDANNWLFTARGIPVIYYGSEIGFERGTAEHAGNRNYFGVERIEAAKTHPIQAALTRIAKARAASPALQRGLQLNIELKGDRAAFYRVYQHDGQHQIALVLLNKGDAPQRFEIASMLQAGQWRSALDGGAVDIVANGTLASDVAAHGVQVYLLDAPVSDPALRAALDTAMAGARRKR